MHQPLALKNIILVSGDLLVFAAALATSLLMRYGIPEPTIIKLYLFAAPFLMALWFGGLAAFGLYDLKIAKNEPPFFERLARAMAFNFVVTVLLFYLIPEFRLRPLATLIIIFFTLTVFLFGWRKIYNTLLAQISKERVLFWGFTPEVLELTAFLMVNPQLGFIPAFFLENNNRASQAAQPPLPAGVPVFSGELGGIIREKRIGRIVVAHEARRAPTLAKALFGVVPLGVGIVDLRRFYENVTGKVPVSLITETWFLENLVGMHRPRYEFAKRILDLMLATILAVVALSLLPFIALGIILSTPLDIFNYKKRRAREGDGIIFFRQARVGKNGRIFNFLKFRSQVLGAEKMGYEKSSVGPDPRSYRVGEFLRKTYLDELPQLWNVILGEMSFAGPRPERPEFVRALERKIPFYRMRELVLPGITGWAQINMENDASVADAPTKIQYDLYYIKNRSLFLDLTILLKTTLKLLQRSGR